MKKCIKTWPLFCLNYSLLLSLVLLSISIYRQEFLSRKFSNVDATTSQKVKASFSSHPPTYEEVFNKVAHIIKSFNETEVEKWNATAVEYLRKVKMINNVNYVYYIDFNGSNGYLIIGEDDFVYKQKITGDFPLLKTAIDYKYSLSNGFVYTSENGSYETIYPEESDFLSYPNSTSEKVKEQYDGQEVDGEDGHIYDIDAYVADRYPTYNFVEEYYLHDIDWIFMEETNVYEEVFYNLPTMTYWDDRTEGHCAINAAYSMLVNLSTTKSYYGHDWNYNPEFIDGMESSVFDVTLDPLYSTYGTNQLFPNKTFNGVSYAVKWRTKNNSTVMSLPTLALQIRTEAVNSYGYTPTEGMSLSDIEPIIENIDGQYGYNLDLVYGPLSSTVDNVTENIFFGIPSVIGVQNSDFFGKHGMMVYGYRAYSYSHRHWLLGQLHSHIAYFWAVDSGWTHSVSTMEYWDSEGDYVGWYDPQPVIEKEKIDNEAYLHFLYITRASLIALTPIC